MTAQIPQAELIELASLARDDAVQLLCAALGLGDESLCPPVIDSELQKVEKIKWAVNRIVEAATYMSAASRDLLE